MLDLLRGAIGAEPSLRLWLTRDRPPVQVRRRPGMAEKIEAPRASIPRDTLAELVERGRSPPPVDVLAMAAA